MHNASVILGLNGWIERGHDASACLLVNQKIVAFSEEERFTRKRYSYDTFPVRAISYCLHEGGIQPRDLDLIVFGWNMPKVYRLHHRRFPFTGKQLLAQLFPSHRADLSSLTPIRFMDHYLSHAAGSFRLSGWRDAAILILDGQGEDASGMLGFARNGTIQVWKKIPIACSLGYMMEAACKMVGLKTSDAGKLMGLAPHSQCGRVFNHLVLHDNGYRFAGFPKDQALTGKTLDEQEKMLLIWERYFQKRFPKALKNPGIMDQAKKELASSLQQTLEAVIIHLVRILIRKTGCRDVVIGGGVGMNCTANGRLIAERFVDRLFILPPSNDAGVSIGAALEASYRRGQAPLSRLSHIFLGPGFTNSSIRRLLNNCHLRYQKSNEIHRLAARALERGQVVGWFQGRMEGGPRALGNRSILANPMIARMRDVVNRIKSRESWRPLACSILETKRPFYFANGVFSPFMLQNHVAEKERARTIPAVIHVNRTCRYQSVDRTTNRKFEKLIREFFEMTGIPLVLNTSLNIKGEPMVCTPEQALATFYVSGMDHLAIGDFWISKS